MTRKQRAEDAKIIDALHPSPGTTTHYTTDGSQPTTDSPMYQVPKGHKEFMQKCMENAYQAMLQIRRDSMVEVDALLLAGWSFELPEIVNGTGGRLRSVQAARDGVTIRLRMHSTLSNE